MNSPRFVVSHWRLLAIAVLLLYAFLFQGSRALWEPDEGRYTNVAMEMLRLGDYLVPRLHYEHPHFTKPPLTYWAIAGSVALFGRSEWAVRLPNALAFVLTTLLLYQLGRLFVSRRPWLPALIYATAFLPWVAANVVTTDTLLALWETLAMTAYACAVFLGTRRRLWMILMWLGFALAFMTKGPPGLLPLLAILVYHAVSRPAPFRALFPVSGLAVFAVVGLSWYAVILVKIPNLLEYFVQYEVIGRVATATHKRNAEWYGALLVYLPTLLFGGLPWNILMLSRLTKTTLLKPLQAFRQAAPETRFLLLWCLLPLLVFAVVRSRLPLYVLPLAVPFALLAARALPEDFFQKRRAWVMLIVTVLILAGIRGGAVFYPTHKNSRQLAEAIRQQLDHIPGEIVFVDQHPAYGLGFYLDVEVEQVCLLDHCESKDKYHLYHPEHLMHELLEKEDGNDRLYLLERRSHRALLAEAVARGIRVQTLGQVRDLTLARVELVKDTGAQAR